MRQLACSGSALALSLSTQLRLRGAENAPGKPQLPEASAAKLPRWRGFNLLNKFNARNDKFDERDFGYISELGFNCVRLPMDYRGWTEESDWTKLNEPVLKEIDDAVGYGEKHAIHVCMNFHRAPGYTVAQPPEAKPLWTDDDALRVCCLHWSAFAKRYRGVPNSRVSFNLLNEPPHLQPEVHRRAVERIVGAIREEDSERLVICDGRDWGKTAPVELVGLGVAASGRGYEPFHLTHYKASWVGQKGEWEEPTYPLGQGQNVWDRARLERELVEPWKKLRAQGVGVIMGEFGSHNRTPHPVVMAWLKDLLGLWKEAGWGWCLWNFYGSFGIVDSGRQDVTYESWRGHKLDRAMLELLQSM